MENGTHEQSHRQNDQKDSRRKSLMNVPESSGDVFEHWRQEKLDQEDRWQEVGRFSFSQIQSDG